MDYSGIKRFLRRTLTVAEIKALSAKAHAAILAGKDVVAITSSSFDGGSGAGTLQASAVDVGRICEELIEDIDGTISAPRQIGVRVDFATSAEAYD